MKMKDLNPAEEGNFPCKLDDWSLKNGNLMVSKIVVIVLL